MLNWHFQVAGNSTAICIKGMWLFVVHCTSNSDVKVSIDCIGVLYLKSTKFTGYLEYVDNQ